ncbi:MAG: hypothetical protein WC682_01780 [Parcubacteria group bacterium]|jgi:hypothetical protein
MSFEMEVLKGKNFNVNMVPGGIYDLPQEVVMRFRIGNEEDVVISIEDFCAMAEHYLQGGVSGVMPECAKQTVKNLVQFL